MKRDEGGGAAYHASTVFATVSQSQMEEGADVNKDAANPALSSRGQMAATWLTGPYWCASSNLRSQLVLEQPERAEAAARGPGDSTESVSV